MYIQFTYNKQKTIQALRYYFISRPEVKILLVVVNLFAIASAALFYLHKISPMAFMVGSLLWFILMLTFWFFLPRSVYKKSSTFQDKIQMEVLDKGMEITTDRGTAQWGYSKFQYYMESPFFFHLYITDRAFFLIPKEACPAPNGEDELRTILENKIGRKKK